MTESETPLNLVRLIWIGSNGSSNNELANRVARMSRTIGVGVRRFMVDQVLGSRIRWAERIIRGFTMSECVLLRQYPGLTTKTSRDIVIILGKPV